MQALRKSLFLCLVLLQPAGAQEAAADHSFPQVKAFAEKLTGITWELRGTNNLKRLRFDGKAMHSVRPDGTVNATYDTVFPDVGVTRLLFRDDTSAWYFFGEDLKFLTSVKVLSERPFAILAETTVKPVTRFPQDIEGVVYESTDKDSGHPPGKIRWNGQELEIGAFQNGGWKKESGSPVVANRRVFEMRASETVALWFVFGADGKEAWLLEIESVFGGHHSDIPAKAAVTVAESGLSVQQNDLANHLMDLIAAGEKESARTLQRQFERQLDKRPDLLEKLKKRVNET